MEVSDYSQNMSILSGQGSLGFKNITRIRTKDVGIDRRFSIIFILTVKSI
jgi:hypothetical protein